jgi:signal transduction histidine kinase
MSDIVAAQTPVLYLAQFVLGLGISIMLTHFSRVYQRLYLRTWSYSGYTFCVHAISFAYFTSVGAQPMLRTISGLLSATFNNIHIVFAIIGIYEANFKKALKKNLTRFYVGASIGIGVITAAAFAVDPTDFIYQVGTLDFLTGTSFVISGCLLLFSKTLRGIGVKIVAVCFTGYGLTHLYDLRAVLLFLNNQIVLLPEALAVVKVVIIALIGFGLIIWLLEDEQAELLKTNKELDKFIYSTSHDLKSPVASLIGLITIARAEIHDQKSTEYLRLIENRVKKLDSVIADILNLSRVKKTVLKYEMVDFNALMADSMSDVKVLADGKKIEIRYLESTSNRFIGDYTLTKMVLGNLLSNAIKYHSPQKPDPYIQVDFERTTGKVSFAVADNGEGIAEEHHKRIFDMFYRASENSNGTGLGLYIVKETLARIGGSVELESKKGTGTTFKVTLEQPA